MTIEVLKRQDAARERDELADALEQQLGTRDRVVLRERLLLGVLSDEQRAQFDRLRALDYVTSA